ncbi:hypothetical protein VNO78_13481 [Psophocarpus tetragonolobus]|uniref:non-specific serine/threonine protein kinase n=1 Tax=Psophocarpus tetragonolobus TaxID=3891 RepID=A0AAN9XQ08_PSOTE
MLRTQKRFESGLQLLGFKGNSGEILKSQNLQGSLPPQLMKLPYLQEISLLANRLTGPIPKELGNLSNLTRLILEFNQLSGNLPPELGDLVQIEKLHLSSNNFTGQLPANLSRLTSMKELRISDLNGPDSTFPKLENMEELRYLYLTGNFFTGPVPEWTGGNNKYFYLTVDHVFQYHRSLFASFSRNTSGPVSCGSSTRTCPKNVKSLHINCGGKQIVIGNVTYDEDIDPAGPAIYKQSTNNWAFSNTGNFMDNDTFPEEHLLPYTTENETTLYMNNAELYKHARISPMSLTYYGYCLENGNYAVRLHFAEIMFADDKTYNNLGRRLFDVYIQGELVLKDFNIAKEAQGVGKELIKLFLAHVSSNDLEIRFYWAGKGTTYVPYKSVHGPLISAISVNQYGPLPGLIKKETDSAGGKSVGVIAIVVLSVIVVILIVASIVWWKELEDLDLQTGAFTLHQIIAATNNFDVCNKIGEGGFGPVYKARLLRDKGDIMELVDSRLGLDFNEKEVMLMVKVALLCTDVTSKLRPCMSSVLSMLEGRTMVPEFVANSSEVMDEMKLEVMREFYSQMEENRISEAQGLSLTIDAPWTGTGSSSSAADLGRAHLNASYWQKKKLKEHV